MKDEVTVNYSDNGKEDVWYERFAALTHEILHHILGETIFPHMSTRNGRIHDVEGLMRNGLSDKTATFMIGCWTYEALLKAGVRSEEVDQSLVIRYPVP